MQEDFCAIVKVSKFEQSLDYKEKVTTEIVLRSCCGSNEVFLEDVNRV
jgi:hypothetical protein